jgi:hypothetical protein
MRRERYQVEKQGAAACLFLQQSHVLKKKDLVRAVALPNPLDP